MNSFARQAAPLGFSELPNATDAEQAVLGAILFDNEAYRRAAARLRPEHFYEPVHGRIYAACARLIEAGRLADPVTLRAAFDQDEALRELDGAQYLARLAQHATAVLSINDYATAVTNAAARRAGIEAAERIAATLRDAAWDDPIPHLMDGAIADLRKIAEASGPAGGALPLLTAEQFVRGYTAPDYCIDGLIQRNRVYSLTGQTGHGKTAVALDLAFRKAAGASLPNHEIEPGNVVYLAAENPDDIMSRVVLMQSRMQRELAGLPLHFIAGGFKLSESVERVKEQVRKIGGASLVFVDTGAAFLAHETDEENGNMTMLRFALDLRAITGLMGNPAVVALMHPTKRATREELLPRGGGAFLAEMDGNLTVWADGSRETTELSWCGKFRGADFQPITFALEKSTCPEWSTPRAG